MPSSSEGGTQLASWVTSDSGGRRSDLRTLDYHLKRCLRKRARRSQDSYECLADTGPLSVLSLVRGPIPLKTASWGLGVYLSC